jgi:hypothetical protein
MDGALATASFHVAWVVRHNADATSVERKWSFLNIVLYVYWEGKVLLYMYPTSLY